MRHSLITTLTFASCFFAKAEDKINLKNGDHFVGKVVALKDGLIELKTPHSDVPLKVLNEDLVLLNFSENELGGTDSADLPKNSQEIKLSNGDTFPGEIIGLNQTHLSFQTWFSGLLEIPREQIDSVSFGVTPQRSLYRGPRSIDSWTQGDINQWSMSRSSLTSQKKGTIGRNFKLTENFVFSANVSWQNSPNMRIHLCSQKEKFGPNGIDNAFMIVLTSTGIQIQRIMPEGSPGGKYRVLVSHTANLREKSSKTVNLELRVDRSKRILQLYLDGNKLEQGVDISPPPNGSCIIIESSSSGSGDTTVKDLMIDEWDATTQRMRLEPRAEDDADTLSVDDGDRFSGEIISFEPGDPLKPFIVKTPLSPEPIKIPLENCAIMYFAKAQETPPSKGQYHLDLRTGGGLTLSGIQLGPDKLNATHPWLGRLEIDRRAMQSISKGK